MHAKQIKTAVAILLCWYHAAAFPDPVLPEDVTWETAADLPLIASPEAKPGGTYHDFLVTYPLTLRTVGPDSNTVLYTALLDNNWSLTGIHPNTREIVPLLATHWAYSKDQRTMYYKLDPKARWSDGKPVTAEDFAYTLEFMRSPHIIAPWYNEYYTKEIETVTVFDSHTLAVTLPRPKPDLHMHADLSPTPKHFYGTLDKDFIQKFNWKIAPNTGPYQIEELKRGKSVTFKRKRDWWANDRPFFTHRFNIDRVVFKVIREQAVEWEHFKLAKLDSFDLRDPEFWYDKSNIDIFNRGYANKLWFYNDQPRSCFGIWLNTQAPVLADQRVREAIAHAMNFRKVIDAVLRGESERLQSCYQGYDEYTNPGIKARAYDEALADKLLNEAGWGARDGKGIRVNGQGKRLELEILYAYDGHTPKLLVLAEEAKKSGIDIKLNLKDWSALIKQKNANKHQVTYSGYSGGLIPDYWGIWHGDNANKSNTNNSGNVNDPELNALIIRYRESTSKEERVSLSHRIQERIHASAAFIPGYLNPFFRSGYWGWWRFPAVPATKLSSSAFDLFSSSSGGLFWYDASLEKEIKSAMKSGKAREPHTEINETYRVKKAD